MSLAPSPCTRSPSRAARAVVLRRHGVEVAGEQHRGRVPAGRRARRCRRGRAPRAAGAQDVDARARPARPRRATPTGCRSSSSVRAARRSPSSASLTPRHRAGHHTGRHALLRHRRLGQAGQPAARARCTSAAGADGLELVGDVLRARARSSRSRARSRASARRGGRRRSTRRPGAGWTCSRAGAPAARRARPARRPLRAHARVRRAALPPRPAALPGAAPSGAAPRWERGWRSASSCSPRSRRSGAVPDRANGALEGAVGAGALRTGALCETYPDAIFCALLGHRPSPKRTPWGLQQRIAALKLKGIVDEDGGLWHRTLDELDACAAAYAAYALAAGLGTWVGDPAEGVIVLPERRAARRATTKLPAAGARRRWPSDPAAPRLEHDATQPQRT